MDFTTIPIQYIAIIIIKLVDSISWDGPDVTYMYKNGNISRTVHVQDFYLHNHVLRVILHPQCPSDIMW